MPRTFEHGGNIFDIARQLGSEPDAIIDFSASINPLGMSPAVRDAIVGSLDSLVHYPDTTHRELKQALAEYHGLSPANIAVANGSTEIIYRLPSLLPGRRALIIAPAFNEYLRSLCQQGWEAVHFLLKPEQNFTINLPLLEQALSMGFDALYLCNPGNPNGTLYPLETIRQIHRLCSDSGTFFVLDEAFMDFSEESSARHDIIMHDNCILLRSMTKFFAIPGLRLGYSISGRTMAERLADSGGPWSVNTMAQTAGIAALRDQEHNRRTLEYVSRERRSLSEQLSAFGQFRVYPSSANYLLVEIVTGMTAGELREQLLEQRLLIRDCTGFRGLTPQFFRVAVRTTAENERLVEALKIMLKG